MRRAAGRQLSRVVRDTFVCSCRSVSGAAAVPPVRKNDLPRQLSEVIKTMGPLNVAAYMRQCLVNPTDGYYTQQNVFGSKGDFVTSPEISQMFGELVGIWFLTEWMAMGKPAEINIVELGPGKGTLLDDLLRASAKFKPYLGAVREIHLLEASDKLREVQRQRLCGDDEAFDKKDDQLWYAKSKYGPQVVWHADIGSIPSDLNRPFLLAHEFFDAMPIHAFEKTSHGWRELLVDIKDSPAVVPAGPSPAASNAEPEFHLTLANKPTPHSMSLTKSSRYDKLEPPSRIEISPESQSVANKIASLIQGKDGRPGGTSLIIDYGPSDTIPIDTLRGIRAHKIVSPFETPGMVDLSVDVDFVGIAEEIKKFDGLKVHGPVQQGDWLHKLGIGARATVLAQNARTEDRRKMIEGEYKRLVESGAMGKVYKVMAITAEPRESVGFT